MARSRQAPSGGWIEGRLIAVRRSQQAARIVRRTLKRAASKRQHGVSAGSWEAAQYFPLWTSLPPSLHGRRVLEMYRSRRQIELALKRLKSIMGLGHLPQEDPASARAWRHGQRYTSLLVERLIGAAKTFSPWGYQLAATTEPLA